MKILFAITGYLPEVFGGAEVYTHHLARALTRRGHDVTVATLDLAQKRGRLVEDRYDGVRVLRLAFTFDYRPPAHYTMQYFGDLEDEARDLLGRERPDVVHVTNAWFMSAFAFAAMSMGIPVIATHVDFIWACRESHLLLPDGAVCGGLPDADCRACNPDIPDEIWMRVRDMRREIHAILAQGFAFHHAPCALMARQIEHVGANPASIGVWPYGVPAQLANDQPQKLTSDVLRVAFIGRWNRIKGLHVLLDAMERLADRPIRLTLYGEREVWSRDTYADRQARRAEALPNVTLAGRFFPERLSEVHREIDAIIVCSVWPENAPVTILESFALGTPVVCADGAGMTGIVRDGENGLLFRTGDADDLADAIARLAGDTALREHLASGAAILRTSDDDALTFEHVYENARPADAAILERAARASATLRFAEDMHTSGDFARRIRRRLVRLAAGGARRIALFGAGRHTLRLLGSVDISGVRIVAILDEDDAVCGTSVLGIPVVALAQANALDIDTIVVSSDTYEATMLPRARAAAREGIRVTGFYSEG
ncbi:glycosyltransferase [bacterium]|nr:glycosyltransferase [bacterium]